MVDYMVVGLGLAGLSFCEVLERHGRDFVVITDASQMSSSVAGGLYNPVNLKRFTPVWQAREQLGFALPFYAGLEQKLHAKLDYPAPVLRRFASIEEQNLWFEATDKLALKNFLSLSTVTNNNPAIEAPFGYGRVLQTGRIDTPGLVSLYKDFLIKNNRLQEATFKFDKLVVFDDHVEYDGIQARRIVFATGFGLKDNPYFNYLPLQGSKGELLTIKAPDLCEESVIKSSVFIIPLSGDLYRIGATYHWSDKTNEITEKGKSELLAKLQGFLKCDYEVVDHLAGIRPSVSDRRPLVGRHPKYHTMYVLNGFGSRGVMIAPYASLQLFDFIENGMALAPEMDIVRFTKKSYHQAGKSTS